MESPPTTVRLFLAVYPPPLAAAAMAELISGVSRARVRRMPVDQIHMTVLFLGDRAAGDVEKIESQVRAAADGIGTFTLTPQRLLTMPDRPPPRLIALETGATPNLHALYRRLCGTLANPEDPPRPTLLPHFTLCRFRGGAPAKPMSAPVRLPEFQVGEIRLMRSVRGPEGAEHALVSAIALDAGVGGAESPGS